MQLVPSGSSVSEAVRFPPAPAELLNSNSIQLWNSLCVAGHEGLNGGIQIIPLRQPLLVQLRDDLLSLRNLRLSDIH